MAGFIRRFGYYPPNSVIREIEGVAIVDLPPPGSIQGVNTGVVAVIGEFLDMGAAVSVDTSGIVTANNRPSEVFSSQDFVNQYGGFSPYLGEFGAAFGNGFCTIRNKRFPRLIISAVDLVTRTSGSTYAMRFWRDLPTNVSATNANPIVPISGASIEAGRVFASGGSQLTTAQRVVFTTDEHYLSGTDGTVTAAAAAATQTFDSASGAFVANGVQVGDILVVGVIGASGAQGGDAGTFRITAITATQLTIQSMSGANFAIATSSSVLVWRIHPAAAADSAGCVGGVHVAIAGVSGYNVPARPSTTTIAAATVVTPAVVPAAATGSTWDPLSGLGGRTHPSGALTYDAAVHGTSGGSNYPFSTSAVIARYSLAIDALMNDEYPSRDVKIVVSSRNDATINSLLRTHVLTASSRGLTRRAMFAPDLSTLTLAAALASSGDGVGALRSERVDYSWPGASNYVPEAVGYTIATSDGLTTTDGVIDDPANAWLGSLEANLAPERNPGQAAEPVPTVLAPLLGFQRGAPKLNLAEYIQLRVRGVCALRFDQTVGPIFQSGVTTSLTAGETNINRRRMADFIQDSIAARLVQFCKLPLTDGLRDSVASEIEAFLSELKSPTNPASQRINDFIVDTVSGNTPDSEAAGIFVVIVKVRTLSTADFIVLQTEIGESVEITPLAA